MEAEDSPPGARLSTSPSAPWSRVTAKEIGLLGVCSSRWPLASAAAASAADRCAYSASRCCSTCDPGHRRGLVPLARHAARRSMMPRTHPGCATCKLAPAHLLPARRAPVQQRHEQVQVRGHGGAPGVGLVHLIHQASPRRATARAWRGRGGGGCWEGGRLVCWRGPRRVRGRRCRSAGLWLAGASLHDLRAGQRGLVRRVGGRAAAKVQGAVAT